MKPLTFHEGPSKAAGSVLWLHTKCRVLPDWGDEPVLCMCVVQRVQSTLLSMPVWWQTSSLLPLCPSSMPALSHSGRSPAGLPFQPSSSEMAHSTFFWKPPLTTHTDLMSHLCCLVPLQKLFSGILTGSCDYSILSSWKAQPVSFHFMSLVIDCTQ